MITVEAAQQILKGLGFDPGPIDGVMGASTKKALSAFQKLEGLLVTGLLDEVTSQRLVARAKEKGIGEGMPWWVWAGIVGGGALIAWGVWRWVSGTNAAREMSAKERMHRLVESYDRAYPMLPPSTRVDESRYPIALGPNPEDIRHLTRQEILQIPGRQGEMRQADLETWKVQQGVAAAKRKTIADRLAAMGLTEDEPPVTTPAMPEPAKAPWERADVAPAPPVEPSSPLPWLPGESYPEYQDRLAELAPWRPGETNQAYLARLDKLSSPMPSYVPEWRRMAHAEAIAPDTTRDAPIPSTVREPALSGFGPKRASMQKLMEIDAKAQKLAYNRWARAMETLGHESKLGVDYEHNIDALAERARMDDPHGAYDAAEAEIIRAEVQRADPKAQARFRKLVDINRRALMQKIGGGEE